jgi:hypothetical protein
MIKSFKDFIYEDGAAGMGGASSAPNTSVDSGCAGTTGNPPVSKKKQKQYQTSQIGLIRPVKPL